jgi:hypothetical protein
VLREFEWLKCNLAIVGLPDGFLGIFRIGILKLVLQDSPAMVWIETNLPSAREEILAVIAGY